MLADQGRCQLDDPTGRYLPSDIVDRFHDSTGPAGEQPGLERDDAVATGPAGYYDDYGLGLGRYTFSAAQVIGHHGVWGAFAFWSPELDAVITGTVNTGRVDRRPLLGATVRALIG